MKWNIKAVVSMTGLLLLTSPLKTKAAEGFVPQPAPAAYTQTNVHYSNYSNYNCNQCSSNQCNSNQCNSGGCPSCGDCGSNGGLFGMGSGRSIVSGWGSQFRRRFGYFYPSRRHGRCTPWAGTYNTVYAVNPGHFDPRDARIYAAEGHGVPLAVPLAPNVRHTYNYGWGIPSSRRTAISWPSR